MIKGLHITMFTPQAEELRSFFRDKLGFTFKDVGGGWLIFDMPSADIGCHPLDMEDVQSADHDGQAYHDLSFYCDDIYETVAELKSRGVEFTSDIVDAGYGLTSQFSMPGGYQVLLYQPYYQK